MSILAYSIVVFRVGACRVGRKEKREVSEVRLFFLCCILDYANIFPSWSSADDRISACVASIHIFTSYNTMQ